MDRLQVSEDESDDLWNSPSKRGNNRYAPKVLKEESLSPEPSTVPAHDGETMFDRQEAREAALRSELESVRKINQVIESLLGSLDRAKGNMDTVSRTLDSASTLLNTWTRILSQTEHNQRLILNPNWQGAVQDVADSEHEELLRQQAAERRERELQQQREAASRKAAEDERKRAAAASARGTRGSSYGRVRTGLGRTPGIPYSGTRPGATRTTASSTTTGRPPTTSTTRRPANKDESPEVERAFSPSLGEAHRTRPPNLQSPRGSPAPALASPGLPSPSHFAGGAGNVHTSGHGNTGFGNDLEGGRLSLGAFDTSLPIRMDIIHLLFSWSSFLSWLLFIGDLAMIGFLSMRAYRDVDTLDHFEVPIFGRLANSFVDDE
ncbi:DASH complex subunit DUO1 [Aspergillus saccharolyticus JOP 1030-1]|uniref:DASH complex subunit DUO1 n=1 Tax=Aspergillus saccharolyticus JOP 1030-1 TaxID=1450539 RepID=A0A319A8A3_9EURO|nr:hypothetical protein BP01DRAFT_417302 [Aspergillus saccharolyticus JOP 1030-1]PYH43322.1 hypothetical protein BP01DRAFT_417302 [Aspergillus saccharolyticus JOP 1030-1]